MDSVKENTRRLLTQTSRSIEQARNPSELSRLVQELNRSVPIEFRRFLELSQDFIHMGSATLAQAYISQCLQYMEHAKGALVQNMSVAGSVVDFGCTSNNIVAPWIQRNRTFLTSAPSEAGVSLMDNRSRLGAMGPPDASFRRPYGEPPVRKPNNRATLMPINENATHSLSSSTTLPSAAKARPLLKYVAASSSNDDDSSSIQRRRGRAPSNVRSSSKHHARTLVRSTPIRPDVEERPFFEPNDENSFSTLASPKQAQTNKGTSYQRKGNTTVLESRGRDGAAAGGGTENELLTNYSPPELASQSKKKVFVVRKVSQKPNAKELQSQSMSTDADEMNTTITKHGRVSKPPKKFSFIEESKNKVAPPQKSMQTQKRKLYTKDDSSSTRKNKVASYSVAKSTGGSSSSSAPSGGAAGSVKKSSTSSIKSQRSFASTSSSSSVQKQTNKSQSSSTNKEKRKGPPEIQFDTLFRQTVSTTNQSFSDDSD